MNIVFIGMSGSGKSTFARYCAKLLNMPIIDLDDEICKKYGGSVPMIFAAGGEALFRELETKEATDAAELKDVIIATGGGTVLSAEAMTALKKSGLVVYLNCSTDVLIERLNGETDERPLLAGELSLKDKIEKTFVERERFYLDYADVVINESELLKSRNLLDSPINDKLGAIYLELVLKLEKKYTLNSNKKTNKRL